MTELPGFLNVNINNKNENTQWLLDEKFIFQGEKLEISLPAGQYYLAVNSPFFEKKNTNVTIEKGEPNNLDLELNNINGFIKIDSEPANASVFINKKKIGQTPIIFKDQGGRYMIEVKKENYEKINETIIITNQNKVNSQKYLY